MTQPMRVSAERCKNWRPEMLDWYVTSIATTVYSSGTYMAVSIGLNSSVNAKGWERVILDFDHTDRIPWVDGLGKMKTFREVDGSPAGTILVWDEKPVPGV